MPSAGMSVIGFDDLAAGMTLADEVRDQQGRLLIPAGTELTERHLRALQLWGIPSVRIRMDEAEPDPSDLPLSAEHLAQGEAVVLNRLRETDPAHPFVAELVRLCAIREGRRLALGASHGG